MVRRVGDVIPVWVRESERTRRGERRSIGETKCGPAVSADSFAKAALGIGIGCLFVKCSRSEKLSALTPTFELSTLPRGVWQTSFPQRVQITPRRSFECLRLIRRTKDLRLHYALPSFRREVLKEPSRSIATRADKLRFCTPKRTSEKLLKQLVSSKGADPPN
jgi:hypothetical protein